LISNLILSDLNKNKFSLKSFYSKRIKRILPALYSTLLISTIIGYILLTPKALIEFSKSLLSSMFFYSNVFFNNLDFYNSEQAKFMPLIHTWSLAIEEQFYIIFPIIFLIFYKKFKNKVFIIFLTLFIISIFLNSSTESYEKFYLLQFRFWELLTGVLLMCINVTFKSRIFKYIGLILIFTSIFHFDDNLINSIEPRISALFGVVLFLLSTEDKFLRKIFENKQILYIGFISYSMYLLHQPLFSFYKVYKERNFLEGNSVESWILIVVLVLLSYFSWKYVELYFLNDIRKTIKFLVTVTFLLTIFYISTLYTSGFRQRYSHVPDNVFEYSLNYNYYPDNTDENLRNWKTYSCSFISEANRDLCLYMNEGNDKTIFIIGDSHANTFSVSVLREATDLSNAYNLAIFNSSTGRCILSGQHDNDGFVGACERSYYENFLNLLNPETDIVVVIGRFDKWLSVEKGFIDQQCEDCDYIEEIDYRLLKLKESSKKLIIFDPVPTYNFPIAKAYIYKYKQWGTPITIEYEDWKNYIYDTKTFLSKVDGGNVIRINSETFFCDSFIPDKCVASTENILFYTDDNHLTFEGSEFLTLFLQESILKK
jgi:peptidoglycan/LPS O-acetylase OafA/YrhL